MAVTQRAVDWLAIGMMVVATIILFVAGLFEPWFETDSWSYLELSNSVFSDFYRYNTLRQFEYQTPYSIAFPPLWPVLTAVVGLVANGGIYNGYFLNFFICLGLLAALIWLARRLGMPASVGALAYCCTLTFTNFLTEALAARSIPLALLLLVSALAFLARPNLQIRHAVGAGVCMGLNAFTRYDVALGAAALGLVLAFQLWYFDRRAGRAVLLSLCYYAAMIVMLSPWMVYNWRHFGTPLATDNARQVQSARRGHVVDYYHRPPVSDMRHNPKAWLIGMATQKAPLVINRFIFGFLASALPWLIALVVVSWMPGVLGHATDKLRFAFLAVPLMPAWILPPLLSGYGRERYYIPSFLLLALCLLAMLHTFKPELSARRRVLWLIAIFAAMPVYADGIDRLYHAHRSLKEGLALTRPTPEMEQLAEAVNRDAGQSPHRLMFTLPRDAAMFGALTGEPASFPPQIIDGTFADFVKDWDVTHVYNPDDGLKRFDLNGVELEPLDMPNLYRIKVDRQPSKSQ